MAGRRRKFLRCRRSKTATALILSLFLRVKILHLAHRKFLQLFFFSEVTIVIYFQIFMMSLLLEPNRRNIGAWLLLRLEQHGPNSFPALQCWEKQCGHKFEQGGSMHYIVFFNLVRLVIHFEKITHLKKFSSKKNWKQAKKLDLFCKKLSANKVNFSV